MEKVNKISIKRLLFSVIFLVNSIILNSCNEDGVVRVFEAAFATKEAGIANKDETSTVLISFSTPTVGEITLGFDVSEVGVSYGEDYSTDPAISDNVLNLTVPAGSESASFTVERLVEFTSTGNEVTFTFSSISGDEEDSQIVGEPVFRLSFDEVISKGGVINLETGGSTQPNQCYIDLSTFSQKPVRRDTWELAFYSGIENRVFLNAALTVSAAELAESTDIDKVTSTTEFATPLVLGPSSEPVTVTTVAELMEGSPVSYSQYGNFCDSQDGGLEGTAFSEISATDSDNKVYLVSLGKEIPTEEAKKGSINTTGDHRGFYKVRVLMDADSYLVQYADIDATTHKQVRIAKNHLYNHVFLSLTSGQEVDVEPAKENWDINMSGVFSYHGSYGDQTYGLTYSDYGIHNTLGKVGMYMLTNDHEKDSETVKGKTDITYEQFKRSNVAENDLDLDNRSIITSGWRSIKLGQYDHIYFIVKDSAGNYYKLKFTRLFSENGERGYSQFKYELLE